VVLGRGGRAPSNIKPTLPSATGRVLTINIKGKGKKKKTFKIHEGKGVKGGAGERKIY